MAGRKKGNFAHPRGRRIDEVFKRTDWNSRVNKRVITSMVDFCFSINGSKSLLDETTLQGLVQVLEKNGIRANLQDCKEIWYLHVDPCLNEVCQTNVDPKEALSDWNTRWDWSGFGKESIFGVMSKRLHAVFDERIALRGYVIGHYYKTLLEEQEDKWAVAGKREGIPSDLASPDPKKSKPFEDHCFYLLVKPQSSIDFNCANLIKNIILELGGTTVDELKQESVLISSFHQEFNLEFLSALPFVPTNVISIGAFMTVVSDACSGKPWQIKTQGMNVDEGGEKQSHRKVQSHHADEDAIEDLEQKQPEEKKVLDEQDNTTLPIKTDPACSQNGIETTLGYDSDACTEVMDTTDGKTKRTGSTVEVKRTCEKVEGGKDGATVSKKSKQASEEDDLEIFAIIFGMVERNEKAGTVSLRANIRNDAQEEYERRKQKAKDLNNFFSRKLVVEHFNATEVFAKLRLDHKTDMGVTEESISAMAKFVKEELKKSKLDVRDRTSK